MKLKGKTALVTGASRGIGRAIALELAREGASIAVNYNKNKEEALKVAEDIKKTGSKALIVQADVSKEDQVKNMVKAVLREFGKIDMLVNNAGIYNRKKFEEIQLKDWEETMKVNLTSMFLCSKEILPYMKENNFGRIVNLASGQTEKPSFVGADYATSKAGVVGLTKSLARVVEGYNIRVNAVSPVSVETGMIKDDTSETRRDRIEKTMIKSIGKPEDIAKAVLFLVSDDSNYITGEVIHLDGGMRLK